MTRSGSSFITSMPIATAKPMNYQYTYEVDGQATDSPWMQYNGAMYNSAVDMDKGTHNQQPTTNSRSSGAQKTNSH